MEREEKERRNKWRDFSFNISSNRSFHFHFVPFPFNLNTSEKECVFKLSGKERNSLFSSFFTPYNTNEPCCFLFLLFIYKRMKEAREMNKGTTHRSFNSAARTGAGFVSFFFLLFGFFFVPFRFHSISLQTKWNKKPNYKKKTHYSLHILLEGM